jgi:hypothetical protein
MGGGLLLSENKKNGLFKLKKKITTKHLKLNQRTCEISTIFKTKYMFLVTWQMSPGPGVMCRAGPK